MVDPLSDSVSKTEGSYDLQSRINDKRRRRRLVHCRDQ
jgi:hypothetical protein